MGGEVDTFAHMPWFLVFYGCVISLKLSKCDYLKTCSAFTVLTV